MSLPGYYEDDEAKHMSTVQADQAKIGTMVLPDDLQAYAFTREILKGRHGAIIHKTLQEDLRRIDFVSSMPCIGYLVKGTETFLWEQGRVVLDAGSLIALPAGWKLQSDFVSNSGPLEAILIFFSDDLVDAFLRHVESEEFSTAEADPVRIDANPRLNAFMEGVVAVYENLAVDDHLVRTKLIELLHLLSKLHGRQRLLAILQHGRSVMPSRNLHHIMQRYGDQDLTVAELATLAGRSPASFNRDFHRTFGTSPGKWMLQQRMDQARELLVSTNDSVTDIGFAVRYESTSHFIEQFRRHFGETPVQFRRRAMVSNDAVAANAR